MMEKELYSAFMILILIGFESALCKFKEENLMYTSEGKTVDTNCGQVKGRRDTLYTLSQKTVDTFLGIPYAKPPLGDLRFKKPQSTDSWTEVKNATQEPDSCPQNIITTPGLDLWSVDKVSEDCLYLNVFLPKTLEEVQAETAGKEGLAVMVWIHGGGFYMGSSTLDLYDGRYLAASTGTIVVSMNYRLGAFGFLNLKSDKIDANIGLLDQVEALKWVRENIEKFGGNRNKVTIFGESAGAASVGLHLLSDHTTHKFNQAILQSGSALSPWAVISFDESVRRSKELATKVGCEQTEVDEIVKCLRAVEFEKILEHQWLVQGLLQFPFVPTVDGKLLKDTPEKLLSEGDFSAKPILAGSNKDEATFFLAFSLAEYLNPANPHMNQTEFQKAMGQSFYFFPRYPTPLPQSDLQAILAMFSPPEAEKDNLGYNFHFINQAVTDSGFICPMNKFLTAYSAESEDKIFSYLFTQRLGVVPELLGVPHGVELFYTFGSVLKYGTHGNFTEKDILFSQKLVQLWSNFAKYTTPNHCSPDEISYPRWPKFDSSESKYLELNEKYLGKEDGTEEGKPAIGTKLNQASCAFWDPLTPDV